MPCSSKGIATLRMLDAGAPVLEVYAAPELFLGTADAELVARAEGAGAHVIELGAAAFASISAQVRPDGRVAIVEPAPARLGSRALGPQPLLLVAESVVRPGNLGTIVRAACAAGASGLVVRDPVTDPFHPEVVRGSVGTLFDLPVVAGSAREALAWRRGQGVRLAVTSPAARRAYWEVDYSGAVALVVGSERHSVTPLWLDAADETVRIPMPGPADSLNVAVVVGIVLFEAARQRAQPTATVSEASATLPFGPNARTVSKCAPGASPEVSHTQA